MGNIVEAMIISLLLRAGSCAKLKVKCFTYGEILADWE